MNERCITGCCAPECLKMAKRKSEINKSEFGFPFTLRSFSIISSMLMSPFWDTLLSMLVSHSQSSLYFSLKTVHSFSFSLTCCLRSDSCRAMTIFILG